jgi:hypothetical protein
MTGPLEQKSGPKKIVSAFVTNDPAQAELVKNALIAEGIQCEIEPPPRTGLGPSDVRVLVRTEDLSRAHSAIESKANPMEHP